MRRIVITVGEIRLTATLNDSATATEVWNALPIQAEASVWGDEVYFEIPVHVAQTADARAEVDVGSLGYWPLGNAFCIFYGPTPASRGPRPRAYSPVNIIGEVMDDVTQLRGTAYGAPVRVARAKS